jgi:hypothetical protein
MPKTKRKQGNRNSGTSRRTAKRIHATKSKGGTLIQAATMRYYKKYISVLESRLVNKCKDYDWVQKERANHYFHKKDRNEY